MRKNIKFLFVDSKKANLPELDYYAGLLNNFNPNLILKKRTLSEFKSENFYDFIWLPLSTYSILSIICLLRNKKNGTKLILDIRSTSVPPLVNFKDFLKIFLILILRPDYILFLNESVECRFKKISDYIKFKSFLIDMPIPEVESDNYINTQQLKKYRIFSVIKNIKNFREYILLRNKIIASSNIYRDLIICTNKKIFDVLETEIKRRKIDVEIKSEVKVKEYHTLLKSSLVHFIPYRNQIPYNLQTSTRVLDSILNNVFFVSINSIPNMKTIDFFEYKNFSVLLEDTKSYPEIIVKIPDKENSNIINKRISIYRSEYDKKLYKLFIAILGEEYNKLNYEY